jgi:putative phosphoesterase
LKKRIAVFSDIHGNLCALNAVLNDIKEDGGADEVWILGDLAAFGYAPVKTLDKLSALENVAIISGNTDRFIVTGEQPYPSFAEVAANPNLLQNYTEVTRSLAWTQGAVSTQGWLPWLKRLPKSRRLNLLDGTRVLLVHASPEHDDGPALYPLLDESVLRQRFVRHDADLILCGHTHWTMEAKIDGVHIVNVGSISNPFPPDLRAVWIRLDITDNSYQVITHKVDYDREKVVGCLNQLRHPGRHYIIGHMRGEHEPSWRKKV